MNKYYTKNIKSEEIQELKNLRGAHNLWYVYCKPELKNIIKITLEELKNKNPEEKYKHEEILENVDLVSHESLPLNSRHLLYGR